MKAHPPRRHSRMCYSMTGFPPNPVILVTPVTTAIGCGDWGDGNPEWRRKPPERRGVNLAVRIKEGAQAEFN